MLALTATESSIAETICKAAERKKADYLVMGRRGMSTVQRLFMGSVSQHCIDHAPCNVIIVKNERKDYPEGGHTEAGEDVSVEHFKHQ